MNTPNAVPQNNQPPVNVPATEHFRRTLFKEKQDELNQELRKYERYCLRSQDLENILRVHNFLLRDSFKEIKALYERFLERITIEDEKEREVLEHTFHLLFIENALDFYNEFQIRTEVSVPEEFMENKEEYTVTKVELVYKGLENEDVIEVPDIENVSTSIKNANIPFSELKDALLTHPFIVTVFTNIVYSTLMNTNIAYNTVYFRQDSKEETYYNGSSFKKIAEKGEFSKLIKGLDDVAIYVNLVPKN